MENATRALTMAASILIAMMVIGIGTYIFNTFSTFSKEEQEKLYEYTITEFNVEFTKYETMKDIGIHDIISLANYAKNYNDSNQITDKSDPIYIDVNIRQQMSNIETISTTEKNNLIEDAIDHNYKYELETIGYNNITGRVNGITFRKID